MKRFARALVALAIAAGALSPLGCAKQEPPRRTLSEHERDSLIGVSGLPGASVVNRALAEQDSAAKRAARMAETGP